MKNLISAFIAVFIFALATPALVADSNDFDLDSLPPQVGDMDLRDFRLVREMECDSLLNNEYEGTVLYQMVANYELEHLISITKTPIAVVAIIMITDDSNHLVVRFFLLDEEKNEWIATTKEELDAIHKGRSTENCTCKEL